MRIDRRKEIGRIALLAAPLALAACDAGGNVSGPSAEPVAAAACEAQATVDIPVGGTLSLTAAQAACFRVAPHAGAQYALAAFDARAVDAARTGPEAGPAGDPTYAVGDGSAIAPVRLPSLSRSALSAEEHADFSFAPSASAAADPADPFARGRPWAEGERFPIRRSGGGEAVTARVVKVLGGRYVFAVVEADEGSHSRKIIGDTEKAMDYMLREGAGVLERAFGERAPVTSDASGQLLVVFASWNPDHGAGAATTRAQQDGSGVASQLWINLENRPGVRDGWAYTDNPAYRLKVLAHEMAHAWQMRYAYESQGTERRAVTFGPAWAMEGSADLLAVDLVRRYLGVGLASNWDWTGPLRAGEGQKVTLALEPADTRGRLQRGYFDASSFLRDVQLRLVRRGLPGDAALAEVARGAVEGWFGIDAAGVRRRGLAERVGAVLGAAWDPADGVLLWTLAQALDDETPNPELDNPAYRSVADGDYAWKPATDELRTGRAFAYEFQRSAGSSFYVRLKDDGRGGTFSARSATPGTRWMIARAR